MLNNAIRNIARSTMTMHSRRLSSGYSNTFITADKNYSFSKKWLADPSTYPLITVLTGAGCLCSGFMLWFITSSQDVRINPSKRHELIRRTN